MNMEDLIANETVIITISEDDYIKRNAVYTFREQRRGGQGVAGMQLKQERCHQRSLCRLHARLSPDLHQSAVAIG